MTIGTRSDLGYALDLIRSICRYAGDFRIIADATGALQDAGVLDAILSKESGPLFDWLMASVSFQGISDSVALAYMERHGRADHRTIDDGLNSPECCPKLASYWHFDQCGYRKSACACNQPQHLQLCPLPRHRFRNGRLNQTAYGLFLFIRDVAGGDLLGWIDRQLENADTSGSEDRVHRMRDAVIGPLSHIYGVSDKVLNMTLSTLLIGAGQGRPRWLETGVSMITIDTLVHNFLHRTGIIHRLAIPHDYGASCYRSGGCAELLLQLSHQIDAQEFDGRFPPVFPRFVQHAIWRFCAQSGLNICNGNRIDDRRRCDLAYCRLFGICDRRILDNKTSAKQPKIGL